MAEPSNYSPAKVTAKDRARFDLGDVGPDSIGLPWVLTDEEIDAEIVRHGYLRGVASCAYAMAARIIAEPNRYREEGGIDVQWPDRVDDLSAIGARFERKADAASSSSGPRVISGRMGGIPYEQGLRYGDEVYGFEGGPFIGGRG